MSDIKNNKEGIIKMIEIKDLHQISQVIMSIDSSDNTQLENVADYFNKSAIDLFVMVLAGNVTPNSRFTNFKISLFLLGSCFKKSLEGKAIIVKFLSLYFLYIRSKS